MKPMCSVPRRPGSAIAAPYRGDRWMQSWIQSKTDIVAKIRKSLAIGSNCSTLDAIDADNASRRRRRADDAWTPLARTGRPGSKLTTTADDWKNADPALLARMLGQLHLIRAFEERVLELAGEGLVHGPAHSSIGQEGGAVGSIVGLRSTRRRQRLAPRPPPVPRQGARRTSPAGVLDLDALVTPEIQEVLQRTLAEILGLAQGYCRGRGGSMHLQWFEAGALGTNAIVGGGAPMATGNAWAQKHSGTTDLTINYFGDGASQIGSVLESDEPRGGVEAARLLLHREQPLRASRPTSTKSTADTRLSVRGQGFGIPSWRVDGMDPLAVHLAMSEAAEHMRSGGGPAVIEAEVYRFFHQNGPYPGSAFGYRTKEEEATWRARDPLDARGCRDAGLGLVIDEAGVAARARHRRRPRWTQRWASCSRPTLSNEGKRRIRPELWPDPELRQRRRAR